MLFQGSIVHKFIHKDVFPILLTVTKKSYEVPVMDSWKQCDLKESC